MPFRLLLLPSRGFPFVSLLLSFLLPLLPEIPRGSSFLLVALFLLPCRSWRWLSGGVFSAYRVASLSLWLFLVRFLYLSCLGSLPCVLHMLFFLASFGYVPAFSWFPSFVTRSNLSSFTTGSSLRAKSPLSVVRSFFLMVSLLVRFSLVSFLFCSVFSPSFSWLCGFPSASSGLPWGFSTSLRCRLAFPVCACFVSLPPFCCSLLLGVFPAHFFSGCNFLLFYSHTVAVSL